MDFVILFDRSRSVIEERDLNTEGTKKNSRRTRSNRELSPRSSPPCSSCCSPRMISGRCNSGPNFGVNREPRQTEPASVEPALRTTGMISTLQAPNFLMAATLIRTLE